jgi:diacylglycerol kinase family enzyme
LFALTKLSLPRTLRHVAEITLAANRGPRGSDVLVLHDQTEMLLRAEHPVPVQVDGDYIGERTQLTLRSEPHALDILY